MEFLGPAIEIVKLIWAPIGKRLKYCRSLDENMTILMRNLQELNSRKEDVNSRLSVELHLGKKTKEEVKNWLENVQRINDETQTIKEKVGEKRYLSRARLGKLVDEKIQEVKEFYQKGSFSDGAVVDAPPSSGVILPATTLVGETTAKKCMNEIWADLIGHEVMKIGVCGMGGVGKTTIMKHIYNRLLEETSKFDNVIWVTVSKEFTVNKLQNDIAHALNEDLSKFEDETIRPALLSKMLKDKKRYVLILDDMWEKFSLEKVGIPEPTASNGCKLVLTTRSLDVCRYMDCKVIRVELLTEEEAWNLFLDKVGRDFLNHPTLVATVKLVAEQCARLPLAIVTIASSMKGVYDLHEWRNALNELRGRVKGVNGMENEVFERLKFSYDRLKDLKIQQCFLYCILYPEDFQIRKRKLIEHWIAEGLMDEMTSREAEYDRGHVILNTLENHYLLESINHTSVKMHDLVRDMALNITRMNPRFMVKAGILLQELPNEQEWTKDLEKVSLMRNSIFEIPSDMSPNCHRLSTLLLDCNPLESIPDSFFMHMSMLKVLDLSITYIKILPNSISDLENLTALLLRGCKFLKYVPSLAKLRDLRTLDLYDTRIKEVPQGMEMLVNLRFLNLKAEYLETLPTGILPKLSHLQCLIIWWGSETVKVKGEEVKSLKKLETFAGKFYDMHDFNIYVRSLQGRGLSKYLLQLGPGDPELHFNEEGGHFIVPLSALRGLNFSKYVGLRKCSISRGGRDPLVLPNNIEELMIKECHDVSSLCDVSSLKTEFLKYCDISRCNGIECVISSSSSYFTPLQSLEELGLSSLLNLRVLFRGEGASTPPPGTFSCLKVLCIITCPKIKKLCALGLLPQLENLEVIEVRFCPRIEEIITTKTEEEEQQQGMGESSNYCIVNSDDTISTVTLPKLRILKLIGLPELKSIICCNTLMVCDSLQRISIESCPKLKRFPLSLPMVNGKPYPPSALQYINVSSREWWESLEWDNPIAKDVLHPFLQQGKFDEMPRHYYQY